MNTDTSAGNQPALAPVYLDNKPISLKDPRPKVSAILSASGKPETTDVKWLQFQPNSQGKPMRSEEVLDRTTDPSKPIYLTSAAKGQASAPAGKGGSGGFEPKFAPEIGATNKPKQPAGPAPHEAPTKGSGEGMRDVDEDGGEDEPKPAAE